MNGEYDFLQQITSEEFARRIAKAFLESRSSSMTFLLQQAFKDLDEFGIEWEPLEAFLIRMTGEDQS